MDEISTDILSVEENRSKYSIAEQERVDEVAISNLSRHLQTFKELTK